MDMVTFTQFVSEMAQEEVILSPADVQRLKQQFGTTIVGKMGRLSADDGSLIVDADIILEASASLGRKQFSEAAEALTSEATTGVSSVASLIERIAELNDRRFIELCQRCQDTTDRVEAGCLQREIIRQIFPS